MGMAPETISKKTYAKVEATVKRDIARRAFYEENPHAGKDDFKKYMVDEVNRIQKYPNNT